MLSPRRIPVSFTIIARSVPNAFGARQQTSVALMPRSTPTRRGPMTGARLAGPTTTARRLWALVMVIAVFASVMVSERGPHRRGEDDPDDAAAGRLDQALRPQHGVHRSTRLPHPWLGDDVYNSHRCAGRRSRCAWRTARTCASGSRSRTTPKPRTRSSSTAAAEIRCSSSSRSRWAC